MARWTITDNSTGTPVVWTFPMNPDQFDPHGRKASISAEVTVGSIGGTILFQGQDEVPSLSFSGKITSETFHDDFRTQFDKWYDLMLTDDQGNTYNIVVSSYTLKRIRSALNYWRFDYTVECKVLP